ncbi:hypothetical protein DH2020_015217 [Rehmannia glutinosa]|uniref:Homeobox domain-containing protein n=1 Tax=Rehmannia glutinosa TaxID=99300 RepID=A0ABR0WW82_REHGL
MMEWEKQPPPRQAEEPSGGGMFVKVMTDEQMEVLRKQIAVYATICEQLVELHKSLTSQNDLADFETNVYNWFQNRRARSKRKQQAAPQNNGESEVETEVESLSPNHEKKTKPEEFHQPPHQQVLTSRTTDEDLCFQNTHPTTAIDPHTSKPEPMLPSEGSSKFGGSFGQMSFYGSMLSNPRMDQFMGKIEVPGNYNPYLQQDDYNMDG